MGTLSLSLISNYEIRRQWITVIKNSKKYKKQWEAIKDSKDLLEATINMDSERVVKALDRSHELVTGRFNSSETLQSAITLAYYSTTDYYTIIIKEMDRRKGYADVVMIPKDSDRSALVIELKKDKSEGKAINEIKEKHYFSDLKLYKGNTLLVVINYDSNTKEHKCVIERI